MDLSANKSCRLQGRQLYRVSGMGMTRSALPSRSLKAARLDQLWFRQPSSDAKIQKERTQK